MRDVAFSPQVIFDCWQVPFAAPAVYQDDRLRVVINPQLDGDEAVTVLHTAQDGRTSVALLPCVAQSLQRTRCDWDAGALTEDSLRQGLIQAGIVMHGADNPYYLPQRGRALWLAEAEAEADADGIRRLGAHDAALFAAFEVQTNPVGWAAAQVDLDDWAVFGLFSRGGQGEQLLSAASIYPWGDSLADVGILTLASARGAGHATRLLRAVGRYAMAKGFELQYRSQLDNKASIALANAAGLALFGRWEIPAPDGHA